MRWLVCLILVSACGRVIIPASDLASPNPSPSTSVADSRATASPTVSPIATAAPTAAPSPTVPPYADLNSITIVPSEATITATGTIQFTAMGLFSDGNTYDITNEVTWMSSNTSLAIVNLQGEAIGAGSSTGGTTTVHVIWGNKYKNATLTVSP